MRKIGKDVPGLVFPEEAPEVIAERSAKKGRIYRIAELMGVDLLSFDDGRDERIFKTRRDKTIYERDCLALGILLDKDEPLPSDLVKRLLEVKEKREKLKQKAER